jgi:hypothetical protein
MDLPLSIVDSVGWLLDVYPEFRILIVFQSRIPDPITTKEEEKINLSCCLTFFVALNFEKFKFIKFFNMYRYRRRFNLKDKEFKYFYPKNSY